MGCLHHICASLYIKREDEWIPPFGSALRALGEWAEAQLQLNICVTWRYKQVRRSTSFSEDRDFHYHQPTPGRCESEPMVCARSALPLDPFTIGTTRYNSAYTSHCGRFRYNAQPPWKVDATLMSNSRRQPTNPFEYGVLSRGERYS